MVIWGNSCEWSSIVFMRELGNSRLNATKWQSPRLGNSDTNRSVIQWSVGATFLIKPIHKHNHTSPHWITIFLCEFTWPWRSCTFIKHAFRMYNTKTQRMSTCYHAGHASHFSSSVGPASRILCRIVTDCKSPRIRVEKTTQDVSLKQIDWLPHHKLV